MQHCNFHSYLPFSVCLMYTLCCTFVCIRKESCKGTNLMAIEICAYKVSYFDHKNKQKRNCVERKYCVTGESGSSFYFFRKFAVQTVPTPPIKLQRHKTCKYTFYIIICNLCQVFVYFGNMRKSIASYKMLALNVVLFL